MTDTDWIHEGAKVAIYRDSFSSHGSYRIATIARITATQIVLDNGQRFRRDRLTEVDNRDYSAPELKPLDDPAVMQAHAAHRFHELARRVEELAREHRNSRRKTTEDVLTALVEIEAAVASARAAITSGDVTR